MIKEAELGVFIEFLQKEFKYDDSQSKHRVLRWVIEVRVIICETLPTSLQELEIMSGAIALISILHPFKSCLSVVKLRHDAMA